MYLGIDVHKRHAQVAVIDDDGDVVEEVRVKNANLAEFAQQYAGGKAALEATSNYYHIHDTLSEYLDVAVAHPTELDLITKSDKKTDRTDAKQLARLARLDAVPESYVPSEKIRKCRKLGRARRTFLENRTEFVNKIHGVLADNGITKEVKPLSKTGREFLEELSLETPWDTVLDSYLAAVDLLTEKMEKIEDEMAEVAEEYEEIDLLKSAPGVANVVAVSLLGEIGNMNRFENEKSVTSYVGLNPTIRESGDSRIEGGISKKGSSLARHMLYQAANVAVHVSQDEYLTRYYERQVSRKSEKEAMVATSNKLLTALYYMVTRGEEWNPPGVTS